VKQTTTLLLLFCSLTAFSQTETEKTNGLFYKISLATTLTINEDYTIEPEDGEPFLNPSALFVNNTVGYQFDRRTSLGLNFEYNWHSKQGLHFFPAYLNLQHNLFVTDVNYFVRAGYGTLLQMGNSFEKGNLFKLGFGVQGGVGNKNNSMLLGLDFTRKRFGYKNLEGVSSVSIFLEFMFF